MLSIAFIDVGFVFYEPQLQWYVGFSGVLHGALAAGAIAWWRSESRALALTLSVFFVGKLLWEQLHGALPLSGDLPVVVDAHLYGALGGAVAAGILWLSERLLVVRTSIAIIPRPIGTEAVSDWRLAVGRRRSSTLQAQRAPWIRNQLTARVCPFRSSQTANRNRFLPMSFAFVFPGQGSQSIGMLATLARTEPLVQETFAEASEVLGYDLWNLCQAGPEEQLGSTEKTQPAMLSAGVATWRVWQKHGGPSSRRNGRS